jgi:hypothetical protein
VFQVDEAYDVCDVPTLAYESDSGLLGTGVDFQGDGLPIPVAPVDEPDGEGIHAVDAGASAFEQKTGPFF